GARRDGHALLRAAAYPAMGLMLTTVMLAYSRGALAALLVGAVVWFWIVPLRLRGASVLVVGAIGAGIVVAFAFSTHALSSDSVALSARTSAGHQLGVLLAVVLVLLGLAGAGIGFATGRRPPSLATRRRAGATVLALLALAIVAAAGALAVSHRGLTGSISHAVHTLTDPNAPVPSNTPGRLTAVASVRARYWNEALKVWQAHPWLGSGAEGYATARLRYRNETLDVRHAHGYVVQTLADLGLAGLALTLALALAWMAAAGRATHPFNRRWSSWRTLAAWRTGARPGWRHEARPYTPERLGLLSMLVLVVVFGVHSLVDWTWYVPGDACVALLCAGWLAGRGDLSSGPGTGAAGASVHLAVPRLGEVRTSARALAIAGAALIAALLAAWAQWQPQRSLDASQRALALLASDPRGAEAAARAGVSRDPLSVQALFTLAAVQRRSEGPPSARATLLRAVRLQPSNPQTWLTLGEFDLANAAGGSAAESGAHAAVRELRAAIYLNPELIATAEIAAGNQEAITAQNDYVEALRMSAAPVATPPASLPARASVAPASRAAARRAARLARRRARLRARGR
ncbi:MAG TPA: O-antigen ligase family protein, partial [Solirubrobacteraceae bacterium]|nr:O-antigen ligase family protein [Solirubrobacteraceae bacterium]